MKLLLRLLKVLLFSRFRSKVHFTDETEIAFRVWPNDLDPLLHMNNGVYLTLLDLGRIDLSIRCGLIRAIKPHGIYAVVASEAIRFKKSLNPFQKFLIKTKCVYWDERYFYMDQRFEIKNQIAARALIKARFLRKNGERVAPADVFKLMEHPEVQAPQPEVIQHFLKMDSFLQ